MRKLLFIFQSYIQQVGTYRADIIIYLTTSIVLPLILINVWSAVADSRATLLSEKTYLIQYFLFQMIVDIVVSAWHGPFLGRNISQGKISQFLLKPFSTIWFDVANNIGEKVWKLLFAIPIVFVISLFWSSYLTIPKGIFIFYFLITIIFASVINFLIEHLIGLSAFWFSNTFAIAEFNEMFFYLFSGTLFPLSYLSKFIPLTVLSILPYKYIVGFPLDTLLGRNSQGDIFIGIVIQLLWIGILYIGYKIMWAKGLYRYGGFGG